MKRAFSLVELMVVIAIILIVVTLSAISIPAMLRSADQSGAISALESTLALAQTKAQLYCTTVGIRIERAYRTDTNGFMVKDSNGEAIWEDHQQIRLVIFCHKQSSGHSSAWGEAGFNVSVPPGNNILFEQFTFRRFLNEGVTDLPKSFWVAPVGALENPGNYGEWQPSNQNASPYNTFETFYVLFNRRGESKVQDYWMYYLDDGQIDDGGTKPIVEHPLPSERAVIVYDRQLYQSQGISSLSQGRMVGLSRTGLVVE